MDYYYEAKKHLLKNPNKTVLREYAKHGDKALRMMLKPKKKDTIPFILDGVNVVDIDSFHSETFMSTKASPLQRGSVQLHELICCTMDKRAFGVNGFCSFFRIETTGNWYDPLANPDNLCYLSLAKDNMVFYYDNVFENDKVITNYDRFPLFTDKDYTNYVKSTLKFWNDEGYIASYDHDASSNLPVVDTYMIEHIVPFTGLMLFPMVLDFCIVCRNDFVMLYCMNNSVQPSMHGYCCFKTTQQANVFAFGIGNCLARDIDSDSFTANSLIDYNWKPSDEDISKTISEMNIIFHNVYKENLIEYEII